MRATGIDISKWDGYYTPVSNPPQPVNFVIQRLSYGYYGSLYRDEKIDILTPPVLATPVKGAYHYVDSNRDWKTQADFFIGLMNNQYDFWAWDIEKIGNANTTAFIGGVVPALQYLYTTTGKPGLLYINPDTWATWLYPVQNDINALFINKAISLWLAHYWYVPNPEGMPNYYNNNGCANMTRDWRFWQYAADETSTNGQAYGVGSASIDGDVFNGDVTALTAWAKPGTAPPVHPPTNDEYTLTVNGLNVRSGAGSNYALLRTIYRYKQPTVHILINTLQNGYVQLTDLSGYVYYAYLSSLIVPVGNVYFININLANVRNGPSSSYTLVGTIAKNTEVILYETANGYSRIGTNRWVYTQYLTKK
jgi:uncharacterized protein YraI